MLETLAFTLVIGGQFLAAVYLISHRDDVYRRVVPETPRSIPMALKIAPR